MTLNFALRVIGVTATVKQHPTQHRCPHDPDWPCSAWQVQFRRQGHRMTVPFYTGTAHLDPPTAADVMSCLLLDSSWADYDFGEFCEELGYDPDSRRAEKLHIAVTRQTTRLRGFLTEREVDVLGRIQH